MKKLLELLMEVIRNNYVRLPSRSFLSFGSSDILMGSRLI